MPQFELNTPPIRIDTRDFEETIKTEMIHMMRIDGVRESNSNTELSMREMIYGEDGESNEIMEVSTGMENYSIDWTYCIQVKCSQLTEEKRGFDAMIDSN